MGNEYMAALFVDIGAAPIEGKVYGGGCVRTAKNITAEMSDFGWRLGARTADGKYRDHWFAYAEFSDEANDWVEVSPSWVADLVTEVHQLLESQARPWWNDESAGPHGLSASETLDLARQQNTSNAAWTVKQSRASDA
jgi:hypothetical protein